MGSPTQPTTNIPAFLTALSAFSAPSVTSPTGTENYSGIEYAMKQNGVPISPWEATLAAEDPSLDPASHYTGTLGNPEDSYGLWQYNRLGGLGAGIAPSVLTDPYAETQLAARAMGDAVQEYQDATGDSSDAGALSAIAGAGWPGSAALAYQQGRFANLAAIESATGSSGNPPPAPQGTGPAWPTAPNTQPYSLSGVAGAALNAAGIPSAQDLATIASAIGNSIRNNAVEALHSVAFFAIGALVLVAGIAFVLADHGPDIRDAIASAAAKAPQVAEAAA